MKFNKFIFKDLQTTSKDGKLSLSFKIIKIGILYFFIIALYKIASERVRNV